MTQTRLTIVDFLLARSADEFRREWDDLIAGAAPAEVPREVVEAKLRGTFAAACIGLRKASRDLRITAGYSTPLAKTRALRQMAATRYGQHPDFRDEWRP